MLLNLVLILVLTICFITDVTSQRIYNKVIFPAILVTLIIHLAYSGLEGLKFSLLGFAAGLAILIIPYYLGGIGAGDVKLLAAIGAIKGSMFVFNTAIYMAVIGGIMALLIIITHKEFFRFIKEFKNWLLSFFLGINYSFKTSSSVLLQKYPYGVAIVGGALVCLVFKGAWIV
jgi:prepilin peptidase CpaA